MDNGFEMLQSGSACGKIILSGEYAVVFGYPGIAVPSKERMRVTLGTMDNSSFRIEWVNAPKQWLEYAEKIVHMIGNIRPECGKYSTLHVETNLPLGKGMGSSTALVIALSRCLLGKDCRSEALEIENSVNPGNSGLDFAVIWEETPILYQRTQNNEPQLSIINYPLSIKSFRLIDTGTPNETTPELVAWVKARKDEPSIAHALKAIGRCTECLVAGDPLKAVMRDHHRAQVALGVVTPAVQRIIAEIESRGGSAKVLGAGARTGGCGMVLALAEHTV